jgi:hypothetical protein
MKYALFVNRLVYSRMDKIREWIGTVATHSMEKQQINAQRPNKPNVILISETKGKPLEAVAKIWTVKSLLLLNSRIVPDVSLLQECTLNN